MKEAQDTGLVAQYLARLEAELKALPADERREVVLETRSHILERASQDAAAVAAVLSELGPPGEYARQFLPPGETRQPGLLVVLARLGSRPLLAVPLLLAIAGLYAFATFAAVVAVMKLLNPTGVGLWIQRADGMRELTFRVSPSGGGPPGEVFGWWLVVLGFGVAVLIHFFVVAAIRRLGRRAGSAI